MKPALKVQWNIGMIVTAFVLGGFGGWLVARVTTPNPVQPQPIPSLTPENKPLTRASIPCRTGAFMEASAILNSVLDISNSLPQDTSEQTRAELDTILYTVFKQAKSEVHCVAGGLQYGYDRAFADTFRRGVQLAKSRHLSSDVIEVGLNVILTLEQNKTTPVNR